MDNKSDLKKKLKLALKEKKLERTCLSSRQKMQEKIEKKTTKGSSEKDTLDILRKIRDKEEKSYTGDFPDYNDGSSLGGSMEHPD
jgi:hypothetical protein